jgi:nucleotide-binding universal stress UspA family protein
MKILLAIDGSTYSDAAVDEIARRPWPAGSELKVITAAETSVIPVIEPWAMSPDYYERIREAVRKSAQNTINGALARLETAVDKSLKVTSEIIEGPSRAVILDEAEAWGADLIVMGSRGLGALDRFVLGSVSHGVIQHARCSVEIVRKRPPEGKEK